MHEEIRRRRCQSRRRGHERGRSLQSVLLPLPLRPTRAYPDSERDGASGLGKDGGGRRDQIRRLGHPRQQRRHELQEQTHAGGHRGRVRQGHGRQRQEHLPEHTARRRGVEEERWRRHHQYCQYWSHETSSGPGLVQCFEGRRCQRKWSPTPNRVVTKWANLLVRIQATKGLAAEFGKDQIRVNALCPLLSGTGLFEQFVGVPYNEENMKKFLFNVPLGRLTDPSDVANIAAFLGSDEGKFLTGKCS